MPPCSGRTSTSTSASSASSVASMDRRRPGTCGTCPFWACSSCKPEQLALAHACAERGREDATPPSTSSRGSSNLASMMDRKSRKCRLPRSVSLPDKYNAYARAMSWSSARPGWKRTFATSATVSSSEGISGSKPRAIRSGGIEMVRRTGTAQPSRLQAVAKPWIALQGRVKRPLPLRDQGGPGSNPVSPTNAGPRFDSGNRSGRGRFFWAQPPQA